ncbi:alkaline phosphatase [Candidatus Bipolaricaulota bacterium]
MRARCVFILLLCLVCCCTCAAIGAEPAIRNVILMIPDGVGEQHISLARAVAAAQGLELHLDRMLDLGSVTTHSANNAITDSAAAATAIASGYKTNNDYVSVAPDGTPLQTVLEMAEERGMRTGLITTVMIYDATPAAFGAHTVSRRNTGQIASELLDREIEVLLGGGQTLFESQGLIGQAAEIGYSIARTADDLSTVEGDRILGLFATEAMAYELDRENTDEPSLAEMTEAAIESLENPGGFFLMVEGGKIDWAGHRNDAAAIAHDLLAFDEAVGIALDFADQAGDTLVVIVSDHETGGMRFSTEVRTSAGIFFNAVTSSADRMARMLAPGRENLKAVITSSAPIGSLTVAETARIMQAPNGFDASTYRWEPDTTIAEIVSSRGGVAFSSADHTGVPVPGFWYGVGAFSDTAKKDNTEIGRLLIDTIRAITPPEAAVEREVEDTSLPIVDKPAIQTPERVSSGGEIAILFDEGHNEGNTISWERARELDPVHPDWRIFERLAEEVGQEYTLDRGTGSLTPDLLNCYDVLVLPNPRGSFTAAELAAIEDFVARGGGLLALSEAGPSENTNAPIRPFGIQFQTGAIAADPGDWDPQSFWSDWMNPTHPITKGVAPFHTNWSCAIEAGDDTTVLVRTSASTWVETDNDGHCGEGEEMGSRAVAVALSFGEGRVVTIGDNAFHNHLWAFAGNRSLFLNALAWLAGDDEPVNTDVETEVARRVDEWHVVEGELPLEHILPIDGYEAKFIGCPEGGWGITYRDGSEWMSVGAEPIETADGIFVRIEYSQEGNRQLGRAFERYVDAGECDGIQFTARSTQPVDVLLKGVSHDPLLAGRLGAEDNKELRTVCSLRGGSAWTTYRVPFSAFAVAKWILDEVPDIGLTFNPSEIAGVFFEPQGQEGTLEISQLALYSQTTDLTGVSLCADPEGSAVDGHAIVSGTWPRKGPYLLYSGDPDTMTILWELDVEDVCTLSWGETLGEWQGELTCASQTSDHRYSVKLEGLEPNTLYHYRVTHGDSFVSSTFRTAPDPSTTELRFIGWADSQYSETHTRPNGVEILSCLEETGSETLRLLAGDSSLQTMMALAGDWVYHDSPEESWESFFDVASVRELLTMIPIQGCTGNHDVIAYEQSLYEEAGSTAYDLLLPDPYLKYWPYPYEDDHFWSFDYGPIHFVVLDQFSEEERSAPLELLTEQYVWLENDLASNTKPWTIALFHMPILDREAYEEPGMYWPYADRMRSLMETGGVDLYLTGHWHNHTYMETPIPQLVMGSASDGQRACMYYTFDVRDDEMTITAYEAGGAIHEVIEIGNR